jgi:hypothetical protein
VSCVSVMESVVVCVRVLVLVHGPKASMNLVWSGGSWIFFVLLWPLTLRQP